MARVIVASLKSKSGPTKASVNAKRVRDTTGQIKTVRTLDIGSNSFGSDLRYVFGKNVAKARRDNKRAAGVTDGAVVKR